MSPTLAEPLRGFREIRLGPAELPVGVPARSARMPRFVSLPSAADATSVLSRLRVGCLGVGAVGRTAAVHLARLGVGALYICDRGFYKPESQLTQPIDPDEVGLPKAETVARMAKRLSPATSIFAFDGPFQSLGSVAFADVDLVLLASDNILAELDCGQHCLHLGKPLIQASVHGASLTAQVRFYSNRSADGPCPACGLTRRERSALAGEVVYSCDGSPAHTATNPTTSTSHLCAIAGDLAVNQILRHVLDLGTQVTDREIEWNGFTLGTRITRIARRPLCPADHAVWRIRRTDGPLAERTLRELAHAAGMHDDGRLAKTAFRVGEASWIERGTCSSGHRQPVGRFLEGGGFAGRCSICGARLRSEPFFAHAPVPSRLLLTQLDRRLRDLCAEPPASVLVSQNGEAVLFRGALDREGRTA